MDADGFEPGDRVRTELGPGRVVLDALDARAKMDAFYAGTIFLAAEVSAE